MSAAQAEYFSKAEVARQLGFQMPQLQIAKADRVLARTEQRVARLYRKAVGT